jgi:kumamolisin
VRDRYVEIPGSFRDAPAGARLIDAVPEHERVEISIYLKDRERADVMDGRFWQGEPDGGVATLCRDTLASRRAVEYRDDIAAIVAFAHRLGLSIVRKDTARRLVTLAGPAGAVSAAFRTRLHYYSDGHQLFRARTGALYAPKDVATVVDAVLGFDTRQAAGPRRALPQVAVCDEGFLPSEVVRHYGFAARPSSRRRPCIGLIALGGGIRPADTVHAFAVMGLPAPEVIPVLVNGADGVPGIDPAADAEIALGIQTAGAAVPGATIAVYIAPNNTRGFVDAVARAVHDDVHRPTVLAIAWGSPEASWNAQSLRAMEATLRDAARLGVTVIAAAGNAPAAARLGEDGAPVEYPASTPQVLSCGGTRLSEHGETLWRGERQGSGGGISAVFRRPAYQAAADYPGDHGACAGRRVPDVAAHADPSRGYRIVVDGAWRMMGGTSAVTALWAGVVALLGEAAGRPLGSPHALLYGRPSALRPVPAKEGEAASGAGWRPGSGLGSPDGAALIRLYRSVGEASEDYGPRLRRRR